MPRFQVRAVAASGEITETIIEAADRDAAVDSLRRSDALPVSVEPAGAAANDTGSAGTTLWRRRRTARAEVTAFLRALENLIAAGLSADRALAVAAGGDASPALASAAGDMRAALRGGGTLSDAMAAHPRLFDGFDRAMVRAGEAGSALAPALGRLADARARRERLAAAVASALIYPAVLLAAAGLSLIVLLAVVVPQFEALFRESAAELPLLTRIVVGTGAALRDWGWVAALALAGAWLLLRMRMQAPAARRARDRLLLGLPLAGPLLRGLAAERLCRSLAALLDSGTALPEALGLAAGTAGNAVLADDIAAVSAPVRAGERLADAIGQRGVLPPVALALLRAGEESGKLSDMLRHAADGLAEDAETRLRRLVALIEPALIVAIGLVVAVIVLSLLSAIVGVHALVL